MTTAIMSSNSRRRGARILALMLAAAFAASIAGCTAMDPQGAAEQAAPSYYNEPYSQLSPQQKMQLEDHLANQDNAAWRTTASVVSSVGTLAGGTGFLLWGIKR